MWQSLAVFFMLKLNVSVILHFNKCEEYGMKNKERIFPFWKIKFTGNHSQAGIWGSKLTTSEMKRGINLLVVQMYFSKKFGSYSFVFSYFPQTRENDAHRLRWLLISTKVFYASQVLPL